MPLARTRVAETDDEENEGESAEALAETATVAVRGESESVVVAVVGVEALLNKAPPRPPRGRDESAALMMIKRKRFYSVEFLGGERARSCADAKVARRACVCV